ncbi:MAG: 6-phosphofructokinase [bacterium]|nr:6-phosphofructokinase [bacterium]
MSRLNKKRLLKPQLNIRSRSRGRSPGAKKKPALAVVTGGGDCPGLNAALRAVVRRAMQEGWDVYGVLEGFQGYLRRSIHPLETHRCIGNHQPGGNHFGYLSFSSLQTPQSRKGY